MPTNSDKPSNGHGGPRPNSGRPRAAITRARDNYLQDFMDLAGSDLPQYYNALKDAALGVKVIEVDADGEETTYRRPPDVGAAKFVVEQLIGKPMVRVAIDPDKPDIREAAASTQAAGDGYVDPDDEDDDNDGSQGDTSNACSPTESP